MPNGGSDCCGTCWFNSTHEGKPGYFKAAPDVHTRCVIRDLTIESPFWTYCVNHPHHNPERIELPIGPAYVDSGGFPYRRKVLVESPDTEDIRLMLLRVLENIPERPRPEYPSSPKLDEAVIDQLMQFREPRAAPGLRRVCQFDPFTSPEGDNPFGRNRVLTVAHAIEALAAIEGEQSLPELAWGVGAGLQDGNGAKNYDSKKDPLAVIRYYSLRALKHCSRASTRELLRRAADDPNQDVAALAKQALEENGKES